MENHPTSAITILTTIADSLCQQLLAYQAAMATRTETPGVPTLQDVNLQSKLIAAVLRLQKQIAALQKEHKADTGTPTADQPQQRGQTHPLQATHPSAIPEKLEHIYGDPPPLSRHDFETYKHLLNDYNTGNENNTVAFKGRQVNKQWLEYNLHNYYLPIMERRFLLHENQYHALVDHTMIKEDIRDILQTEQQQAA